MADFTQEQWSCIRSTARILVVKAFAGTGKTTMLVGYAYARQRTRFLYIAFNKAIQLAAEAKFGRNVVCRTTHALAYRAMQIFDWPREKIGNCRVMDIVTNMKIGNPHVARMGLATVENFMTSADLKIGDKHITAEHKETLDPSEYHRIVALAEQIWAAMQDKENVGISLPHDGYLKMWHLSGARLEGYDVILHDEAQDANPVTAAIVAAQPCNKVIVGDSHQSIYAFRGAMDAMHAIKADETLALTNSFRFGQGVASVANHLLSHFKGERLRIVGAGKHPTVFSLRPNVQHTVLARTNAQLFREAVAAVNSNESINFVGGCENYRLESIMDVHRLKSGSRGDIRDTAIKKFSSIAEMEDFADKSEDVELLLLAQIGKEYGNAIPDLVTEIRKFDAKPAEEAAIRLTTGHKAKGLEFPQVRLTDDFMDFRDDQNDLIAPSEVDQQEVNLMYVGITRAEQNLALNPKLHDFLTATFPRTKAPQAAAA